MENKKDIKIAPVIIELFILIVLLMSGLEYIKSLSIFQLSCLNWQIITIVCPALFSCIVAFFIIFDLKKHNSQLQSEVELLKKMELDLKQKVEELTRLQQLIVWWEKRISDLQNELNLVKEQVSNKK